jgi:hypothetical protein
MIRGSKVAREISLEKKWIFVPTLMDEEQFFTLHVAAPIVQATVVPTPIVSSPMATMNEPEEPVIQEPMEPNVTQEEEKAHPNVEQVPEAPRRSQRMRRSPISDDYEVYETKEFHMENHPTTFMKP